MNTKIQDKKSNARIAWEEFISNFSLNDKKNTSVKPAGNGTAVYSSPETTVRNTDEKPAFNFREYNEPEIVPPARLVPPRTTVIGEQVDITGNCKIEGDVEIYGEITGDVQAGGTIVVFGKVTGNMSGKNVILNAARVKGSIIAEETIELDDNSVVTDGKFPKSPGSGKKRTPAGISIPSGSVSKKALSSKALSSASKDRENTPAPVPDDRRSTVFLHDGRKRFCPLLSCAPFFRVCAYLLMYH